MTTKWYVTMTDKFLTGWGPATNKICKFVYECESFDEAQIVVENAANRGDQKNINVTRTKPYYSSKRYLVQYKNREENPNWYRAGAFTK